VGLKAAEALADLGLQVTVVASSGHVLSQILDREAAAMIEERMRERGVRLLFGTGVAAFAGEGRVAAAVLSDGSRLPCGVAVVAKGVVPCTGWLRGSPLTLRGGVVVDAAGRTGVPGICAAGDVAAAPDALSGFASAHPIWPEAVSQGRAAGAAMGGGRVEAMPALARNIGAIFGLSVMAVGESRSDSPASDEESVSTWRSDSAYRKELRRQGRLVGVLQVGGAPSGYWQSLVRRQADGPAAAGDLLERRPTYGRALVGLPVTS
jgi:NADPH-dependent 2,4-dienoyl-CoA reductase/sulfur reductase-like enzyme